MAKPRRRPPFRDPGLIVGLVGTIASVVALATEALQYGTSWARYVTVGAFCVLSIWAGSIVYQEVKRLLLRRALIARYTDYDELLKGVDADVTELKNRISAKLTSRIERAKTAIDIDVALSEVLSLAAHLTDDPTDGLTSNLMEYSEVDGRLHITHVFGTYGRWRVHRTFSPQDPIRGGSCGFAYREQRILYIPDTSEAPEMYWEAEHEKALLRGLINIPLIRANAHSRTVIGLLNIDSPLVDVLTEERWGSRVTQIQRIATTLLEAKRDFVG
jgi:hypothetical protein